MVLNYLTHPDSRIWSLVEENYGDQGDQGASQHGVTKDLTEYDNSQDRLVLGQENLETPLTTEQQDAINRLDPFIETWRRCLPIILAEGNQNKEELRSNFIEWAAVSANLQKQSTPRIIYQEEIRSFDDTHQIKFTVEIKPNGEIEAYIDDVEPLLGRLYFYVLPPTEDELVQAQEDRLRKTANMLIPHYDPADSHIIETAVVVAARAWRTYGYGHFISVLEECLREPIDYTTPSSVLATHVLISEAQKRREFVDTRIQNIAQEVLVHPEGMDDVGIRRIVSYVLNGWKSRLNGLFANELSDLLCDLADSENRELIIGVNTRYELGAIVAISSGRNYLRLHESLRALEFLGFIRIVYDTNSGVENKIIGIRQDEEQASWFFDALKNLKVA